MKIAVILTAIFVLKKLSRLTPHGHKHCLGVAYHCYRHTDVVSSLMRIRRQSPNGNAMPTKLNHPRQSRGLIIVSPSKGHVHESPKGDYLFPKTELFIMLLFFFLLPYICLNNLFIQSHRRHKISSGPKVFSCKVFGFPRKLPCYGDGTLAFNKTDYIRNRIFWRNADAHVNMIGHKMSLLYFTALLFG